ncbi:hypothetical protein [Bradyrhizobium sp. USDA 329]|uniref:hypothetical protein n=1 Tax=unclassified Bradyrhizobium TaxID=2631580 RepID=UPI0035136C5E
MTDDSDLVAAVSGLRTAIEILEADLLARARDRACAPTAGKPTYMAPKEASAICGRSESTIRRDCEANPVHLGGFGLKIGGRWRVLVAAYIEQRGPARFRR